MDAMLTMHTMLAMLLLLIHPIASATTQLLALGQHGVEPSLFGSRICPLVASVPQRSRRRYDNTCEYSTLTGHCGFTHDSGINLVRCSSLFYRKAE